MAISSNSGFDILQTKGSVFEKITNNIANSKGIKVLFKEELTKEDWKNLHFDAVKFDGKDILVANSDGFILTACGLGETVDEAGDKVEKLLKKICVPKGFWRNDFHDTNYHHAKKDLIKWGYLQYDSTVEEQLKAKEEQEAKNKQTKDIEEKVKSDYDKKLSDIKSAVKGIIYADK